MTGKKTSLTGYGSLLAIALAVPSLPAQAGRPMSTEDAAVDAPLTCHVEAWVDTPAGSHRTHLSPACGVGAGLELSGDADYGTPDSAQSPSRSLAVKYAPEWAAFGDWRFGAKAGTVSTKAPGDHSYHQASTQVLAVASYKISSEYAVHVNMGRARDKITQVGSTPYAVGLAWTPSELPRWMMFYELTGTTQTAATKSMGVRYWAVPDEIGLDVTQSSTNAAHYDSRVWGVGIGWYGVKF